MGSQLGNVNALNFDSILIFTENMEVFNLAIMLRCIAAKIGTIIYPNTGKIPQS